MWIDGDEKKTMTQFKGAFSKRFKALALNFMEIRKWGFKLKINGHLLQTEY